MYYMSLEVSTKALEYAVINERGALMNHSTLPVSLNAVKDIIGGLNQSIALVFEEGELADWLYRNLVHDVDQIVVAEPWHNYLIHATDTKTDKLDAIKLARLLRGGFIHAVYHTHQEDRITFKRWVHAYHDTVKQGTRCKNQIKALFRQQGVILNGASVYNPDHRDEYVSRLPSEGVIGVYYERYDTLLKQKEQLQGELARLARAYPEIRRFKKIPGVGLITAATFYAIIDDPHRFRRKQQLWSYAHLGKGAYDSGVKQQNRRQKRGNRWLKYVALNAAQQALRSRSNPLRSQYIELTELKGVRSRMAKRIIARRILTTMWMMWKTGEEYRT